MEQLKSDYKQSVITAKDIYLPPYRDDLEGEAIAKQRNQYIT